MSAFERLAGIQEPKLPVWGMITGVTRVLDGEVSLSDLAQTPDFTLSEAEQLEVGEYLVAIGAMVTARAEDLVLSGLPEELATEVARAIVNSKVMHALLRLEQGSHTEGSFRAVFGLS